MGLTDRQQEALVLIYMQEHEAIVPGLHGEIDELVTLGLAGGTSGQWAVTPEGRKLAELLTDD